MTAKRARKFPCSRFAALLNLALLAVAGVILHTALHRPGSTTRSPTCRIPPPPKLELPPNLPKILSDYAVWHRTQRACLLNPRCRQKPKLLVFRCPKSGYCLGLGDRARATVFPLFFAILTNRLFILAWPDDPFPIQAALEPVGIDWTPPPGFEMGGKWPYLQLMHCYKSSVCDWRRPILRKSQNIDLNGTDIDLFHDDLEQRFGSYPVVSVSWKVSRRYYDKSRMYLKDIFGGLNDTNNLETMERAVYQLLFRPSRHVLQKVRQVAFPRGKPYYAVQIRTGMDVNETHENRFEYINTHLDTAITSIFECLTVAAGKKRVRRIFLAADSTLAKDVFVKEARRRGFRVHLFRDEIIHFLKITFLDRAQVLGDICDRFLTVFADLYMLANSRVLISSGSHFATFAHALSENPNSAYIIYRPEHERAPQQICAPV